MKAREDLAISPVEDFKLRLSFKMSVLDVPQLTSSHGHTESIATYGAISSLSVCVLRGTWPPTHQVNKKKPTLRR